MGFIETLLSGLIIAAIGAMTWFAYKHPKGYDKMWTPLMVTGIFISMWLGSYQLGRSAAWRDAVSVIDSSQVRTVKIAVESGDINLIWVAGVFLAFLAFHLFLGVALPRLVEADKDER